MAKPEKGSGSSLLTGRKSTLSKKQREDKKKKEIEKAKKKAAKAKKDMFDEMNSSPDGNYQTSYTRRGGSKAGSDEMFKRMEE